jgi:hypothetical protein
VLSGTIQAPPVRRPRRLRKMTSTKMNRKISSGAHESSVSAARAGWARKSGLACQSAESVVSVVMMSSVARVTPPSKSPALKRGVAALAMMTDAIASVSVPSSP